MKFTHTKRKKIQTWALSMVGYDCKIQYLKYKDDVFADQLLRTVDESKNNDDPSVNIDDWNYGISAINSNLLPRAKCLKPINNA